jgi:hypothetical protein
MTYFVNYLWSIPLVMIFFLFFMSWLDKNKILFEGALICLIGAVIWPLTILFILYFRFYDGYKYVRTSKSPR